MLAKSDSLNTTIASVGGSLPRVADIALAGSRSAPARYGVVCRRGHQHRLMGVVAATHFESQTWLAQPCTLFAWECSARHRDQRAPSSMTYR